MAASKHNRRRTMMVNKPAQGRLIFSMSFFPALGLSVLMLLVAYYCHELSLEVLAADVELESVMPLYLSVTGFVIVSGVFLLYNALKVSHRIAGPSYRICRSIERMRGGDLAFRVTLRDGDHLNEISGELNLLLDWLNENPPPGAVTRAMKEAEAESAPAPAPSTDAEEALAAAASEDASA